MRRITDDSTASSSEPATDSVSRPGLSTEHTSDEAKLEVKPAAAAGKKRLGRPPSSLATGGPGSKSDAAPKMAATPKVPPAKQRLLDYMRELKRHVPTCFNAMRWTPQQVFEYLQKTDSAEFAQKMLDEV